MLLFSNFYLWCYRGNYCSFELHFRVLVFLGGLTMQFWSSRFLIFNLLSLTLPLTTHSLSNLFLLQLIFKLLSFISLLPYPITQFSGSLFLLQFPYTQKMPRKENAALIKNNNIIIFAFCVALFILKCSKQRKLLCEEWMRDSKQKWKLQ